MTLIDVSADFYRFIFFVEISGNLPASDLRNFAFLTTLVVVDEGFHGWLVAIKPLAHVKLVLDDADRCILVDNWQSRFRQTLIWLIV